MRHAGREARIERGPGREHADAVWADEPQALGAGRLDIGIGERAGSVTQARRNDNGGGRSLFGSAGNDLWNLLRGAAMTISSGASARSRTEPTERSPAISG